MVNSQFPKLQRDDYLELVSHVRSNTTAHNIYKLQGEETKTIIFGQMDDISWICKH